MFDATDLDEDEITDEDGVPRWLERRIGRTLARRRLAVEAGMAGPDAGAAWVRRLRHLACVHGIAPIAIRLSGLLPRARRNAANVEVRHNEVTIDRLPPAFDGYRILHLSDLHADISAQAMARMPRTLRGLRYDLCVITGDFRGSMHGPWQAAATATLDMLEHVTAPAIGILGNHDGVAMVPRLERQGLRMLLNESAAVERDGARIWLAGVDDPNCYRTDDIGRAMAGVPGAETVVLLSHSTDNHAAAAAAGVDLFLCGHTHGGQICLPGGYPLRTSTTMPRRLAAGAWRHERMAGYTSRGVGTSVIEARFNCPPEITIHTLRANGGQHRRDQA